MRKGQLPSPKGPDPQSCKESGLRSRACCWQPGSRVHCVEGASWSPVPVWGTQLVLALNPLYGTTVLGGSPSSGP